MLGTGVGCKSHLNMGHLSLACLSSRIRPRYFVTALPLIFLPYSSHLPLPFHSPPLLPRSNQVHGINQHTQQHKTAILPLYLPRYLLKHTQ